MKVSINIPRTFEVTLEQMDAFLVSSGWSDKQDHNELTCKYQCLKFPNVYVILPKTEGCLVDETLMMFNALRLIVNVNNDCEIETIVNRIVGIYETEPSSELSGLSNAEDARKAKDALERINGVCDYVEEVKSIIDKVNQLPLCIPIETRIVHLKVCGVDGGECNFKYRRYLSWHIMGEFDMEVSECRLSGIPKSYPTHLKHCEHTR